MLVSKGNFHLRNFGC